MANQRKHSIRGTYFKNDRTGTNELSRDINFGDETYPLGATTTARWQLEVMQVSYDYAFKRSDKYELAAGVGLHVLHANLRLDATITGAGGSVSRELSQSGSTGAPLPVLGLRGISRRLPHDFYFTAQAQYFYIDYNEYNGSLSDLKTTIVWQATPRFGVGLGYNDFRFRFDLDKQALRRPAAMELRRRHGVRVARVLSKKKAAPCGAADYDSQTTG